MSQKTMAQYHVMVAAEAFAAGLFAQAGCDVGIQYGANQREYDFIASRNGRAIHVSVKGSQDGGWGLNQSYKKGRTYHEAVDAWVAAHKNPDTVYCFVQFKEVELGQCPRVYLATVDEVANRLKESRNGVGETILWENACYVRGIAKGCTDMIPTAWLFCKDRVAHFLPHQRAALRP